MREAHMYLPKVCYAQGLVHILPLHCPEQSSKGKFEEKVISLLAPFRQQMGLLSCKSLQETMRPTARSRWKASSSLAVCIAEVAEPDLVTRFAGDERAHAVHHGVAAGVGHIITAVPLAHGRHLPKVHVSSYLNLLRVHECTPHHTHLPVESHKARGLRTEILGRQLCRSYHPKADHAVNSSKVSVTKKWELRVAVQHLSSQCTRLGHGACKIETLSARRSNSCRSGCAGSGMWMRFFRSRRSASSMSHGKLVAASTIT